MDDRVEHDGAWWTRDASGLVYKWEGNTWRPWDPEASGPTPPSQWAPNEPPSLQSPTPGPGSAPYYHSPSQGGTNGLAIASLVLGIVWIWWIGSVLALVFGYVAKGQIDRSRGMQQGRGLAIAGIVLGWVGIAMLLLVIVLFIGASESVTVSEF